MKPRIFVASSTEGHRLALAVQQNLENDAAVTVWSQDVLQIGANTFDELIRNLERFDYGIFIFSPDDTAIIRGKQQKAVRDNVILELGMFIGRLGRKKCFIIKPNPPPDVRLPTDLLGEIYGTYDPERIDEPRAALGTVCTQIADAIRPGEPSPDEIKLKRLVQDSLEIICRAISVPKNPTEAKVRAFIFLKEGNELVCRYFFDPNPSDEKVGVTRFKINSRAASKVIVVRCYLDNRIQRSSQNGNSVPKGARVEPLPDDFKEASGAINPSLRYVLAAPIRDRDGKIWGVVDFDASNEAGKSRLQTAASSTVILRLAEQLSHLTSDAMRHTFF